MSGARAVLWAWAYAWQLAYDTGRAHERERIADALAELDACRPLARRTWEQQVADRAGPARPDDWPGIEQMTRQQRAALWRALLASWEPQDERRAAA